MSMTGSPSRLSEPIVARDWSVMRGLFSSFTSSRTSTSAPDSWTSVDLADLDAGDADHGAALQALDVGKLRLQLVPLPGEPALPPTAMMSITARPMATTATMPILSSDQASERVRGIVEYTVTYDRNASMYGSRRGAARSSRGVALERDLAVAQHDELRLVGLLRPSACSNADVAAVAATAVCSATKKASRS